MARDDCASNDRFILLVVESSATVARSGGAMSHNLVNGMRELVRDVVEEVLAKREKSGALSGLIDLNEAARSVSLKPATLREWIKAGRLPATCAGRRYRVRIDDVYAALHSAKPKSNARALSPEDHARQDARSVLNQKPSTTRSA